MFVRCTVKKTAERNFPSRKTILAVGRGIIMSVSVCVCVCVRLSLKICAHGAASCDVCVWRIVVMLSVLRHQLLYAARGTAAAAAAANHFEFQ